MVLQFSVPESELLHIRVRRSIAGGRLAISPLLLDIYVIIYTIIKSIPLGRTNSLVYRRKFPKAFSLPFILCEH